MKEYDKNKEYLYLKYWYVDNLYDWAMPQKLSVNKFNWAEDLFKFNEDFIKKLNEKSDKRYFLEVGAQNPKGFHEPHNDLRLMICLK